MKKEDLITLGLSEEQADSVISKYGNMIPLERFNEVNKTKKSLEDQVSTYETQLKELETKANGHENLQAEIQKLQEENQKTKEQFDQQLKDERLNTALKLALAGKVHDADLVASLIDKATVELDDKGAITKGLDEQLKTLQESKSFLFVPEKDEKGQPAFKGFVPKDGDKDKGADISEGSQWAKELNAKNSAKSEAPNPWATA